MANAKEISNMLSDKAEYVAMHLLPNGRKNGKEWRVGGVDGKKGDSLGVCIAGNKAGVWSDFATGETGDLLDLWKSTKGLSFIQALTEAKEFLGVRDPEFVAPKKTFTRPQKPARKDLQGDLLGYLTEKRLIPLGTLAKYNIRANETGEILFPILRNGELINIKYLTPRKSEGEKNKWRQEANAEPCLFGWQGISNNARSVVITEGEIDCLSIASLNEVENLGEFNALSIPAGANNLEWLEYDYPNLDQFDDIVLMLDQDEAGQKHIHEIAQRLGLERVRVAKLPKKDANEMLVAGMAGGIIRAIREAKHMDPAELKAAKEYESELIDFFNGNLQEEAGKALPWSNTTEKVRLRPDELSIWTGINGHGKSQLLGYASIGLISQGEKICIFSGEMKPRRTLERMVRQILGTKTPTDKAVKMAFGFMDGHLWLFDMTGTAKANRLLEVFSYARKRYGINHFIIDSLMKCGFAEDDYNGQKQFVDLICDFKNTHNVHIHLVAHPRKGDDEKCVPGKMDVKGSGSLTDLADNVFAVWRNKIKEKLVDEGVEEDKNGNPVESMADTILFCNKQRNHPEGWEGKIALWFNPESLQYYDNAKAHHQQWIA